MQAEIQRMEFRTLEVGPKACKYSGPNRSGASGGFSTTFSKAESMQEHPTDHDKLFPPSILFLALDIEAFHSIRSRLIRGYGILRCGAWWCGKISR